MPIQNLGYRAINKLETPADFKLLNDTLRAIWIKMLGNLGSKDVNGEISEELTGEFGARVNALTERMTAVEQQNATQGDALAALEKADEGIKGVAAQQAQAIAALDERMTALEDATAAQDERITALEDAAAALIEWQTATNALLKRINERLKALDGLEE